MTTIGNELGYLLGMLGIVAFAVTAVLAVIPKGIDLFGACVMGVITAVGGGTIRDLILDVPVFWAGNQTYIWVALGASAIAFYANRIIGRGKIYRLMLYLDALGVALFAIQAMQKVIDLDFGLPLAPIVLGVITAIGGGLLRDMLADSPTLLMSSEVYAIPITLGCILYLLLATMLPDRTAGVGLLCMALIFAFRSAAIYRNLHVARWMTTRAESS
ncbi:MAG: TRIC cation channel family protein [Cyanobacteria bacterium P01_E01_bin.34]